jgi:hypothetical protein
MKNISFVATIPNSALKVHQNYTKMKCVPDDRSFQLNADPEALNGDAGNCTLFALFFPQN